MSRDLRKYARQTNVRLAIGMALIYFIQGAAVLGGRRFHFSALTNSPAVG